MDEKTYVDDIDRSVYDIKDEEKNAYRLEAGLTPKIVEQLSKEKHDPAWMEQFRLQSLQNLHALFRQAHADFRNMNQCLRTQPFNLAAHRPLRHAKRKHHKPPAAGLQQSDRFQNTIPLDHFLCQIRRDFFNQLQFMFHFSSHTLFGYLLSHKFILCPICLKKRG